MTQEADFISREERQANMNAVLSKLDPKEMDFNKLMFTLADIMQSSFMNGIYVGKEQEEREALTAEITDLNNKMVEVLNTEHKPLIIDVIVLTNLLMDSIANANDARRRVEAEEAAE